jgi:hypothetical protein
MLNFPSVKAFIHFAGLAAPLKSRALSKRDQSALFPQSAYRPEDLQNNLAGADEISWTP